MDLLKQINEKFLIFVKHIIICAINSSKYIPLTDISAGDISDITLVDISGDDLFG